MKTNHLTLTHCVIAIAAAVGLLIAFGVQIGTLFLLAAVLVCPLMMVFMMRAMMGGEAHHAPPTPTITATVTRARLRGPSKTDE